MKRNLPFWKGKTIVITGSARGIGRKTAEILLLNGAQVVINARTPDNLDQCLMGWKQQPQFGGFPFEERLLSVPADVSTPEGARTLVQSTLDKFGRIDLLINNAGLSMRGPFAEVSPAVVRNLFASNFDSAFFTTQAALEALQNSSGAVYFISSLAGVRGFPGVSIYSAAKAAVAVFRQSLEAEHPNLHSGIVFLGFTENDQEKTIFAANGELIRHERRWQMTQEQAALATLKAAQKHKRKTVLTGSGKALVFFQSHFPGLVDWLLRRSGGRIHQIKKKG